MFKSDATASSKMFIVSDFFFRYEISESPTYSALEKGCYPGLISVAGAKHSDEKQLVRESDIILHFQVSVSPINQCSQPY